MSHIAVRIQGTTKLTTRVRFKVKIRLGPSKWTTRRLCRLHGQDKIRLHVFNGRILFRCKYELILQKALTFIYDF